MASPKKRSRVVVTVVCALLAVCLAASLVFFGLAKRKLSALQTGADFDLIYGVTAQSSTAPALYTILEQAGATAGRVTGLYSPAATRWPGPCCPIGRWAATSPRTSWPRCWACRPLRPPCSR